MDVSFKTLRERIGNRAVVLDENVLYSNLRQFLTANNITWRTFRRGVTDEDIMRNLKQGEVVITADRRFAYALQERGILIPLSKSHREQMERLLHRFDKRNGRGSPWADIATCPICSVEDLNKDELTFWDADHMARHIRNPVIQIRQKH